MMSGKSFFFKTFLFILLLKNHKTKVLFYKKGLAICTLYPQEHSLLLNNNKRSLVIITKIILYCHNVN